MGMEWTIKRHWHEKTEWDGHISPARDEEYTLPFLCGQDVYYVHRKKLQKKRSPWVITKSPIVGVWADVVNYGIILNTDECLSESQFKYLFKERDEAIDFCLKKNAGNKVKIYGEFTIQN